MQHEREPGKIIDFLSHPLVQREQAEWQAAQDAWDDPVMRQTLIEGYGLAPDATFEDCLRGIERWIDSERDKIEDEWKNIGMGILFEDNT